ncbi:MAG: glycosyltransferase family 2 protein [Candidatus Saccharimonadales bacterium]
MNWSKWNSKSNNFQKYSHIKSHLIYGELPKDPALVSIMILTYKRAHGLKNALESALAQHYDKPYSIVVLDDSGFDKATDDLMKEYCKKYNNVIYYRHEKNLGQYANWNRACELCPTEWYCLLHDDDMLKSNYLAEVVKYTPETYRLGLLGVYIDVNDTRDEASKTRETFAHKAFTAVQKLFMNINGGKCIVLTKKDNIKHIYVMNSTFINRSKAIDIGGLDDSFFPSSDFAFAAKMCHFYKTGFLPVRLTNKGVGESESLKQSVCDDSIRCSFYQTKAMCEDLGYSTSKQLRKASIAAVIAEIGVRGYNDVDYGKVKQDLGMAKIYNNKGLMYLINLYSKFNWGLLLFRKNIAGQGNN